MALADIRQGYKNQAWFDANPTLVLKEGQVVHLLQTGRYKIGDGITELSDLDFIGSRGGVAVYTNEPAFPPTGDVNTIYLAKDVSKIYQWDGLNYVQITT